MAVVVVDFNGGDDVVASVDALLATDWPRGRLRVVLVDNASHDGSAARAAALDPSRVQLVTAPVNRGFGAGSMLGIATLKPDEAFVALVNPDAFVGPGWLAPLVEALQADEGLGAACSKLLLASDAVPPIINNAGALLRADGYGIERGFGEPDRGQHDAPGETFGWSGGCALLRRAYLDDVGGLDERLFLYYEDTDLAWRGRLRGWRYAYVPSSVVRHRLGGSTGAGRGGAVHAHHSERNRLVVLAKLAPWRLALAQWARFPLSTLSYAVAALRGRRDLAPAGVVGRRCHTFAGALGLLPHALRERRRVRARSTVADADIIAAMTPVATRVW
ncbi:MAG: glycosyltransferase family 2 protein [Acidimicrobiales bacterium]